MNVHKKIGFSQLHIAVLNNYMAIAKLLMIKGADVNAYDMCNKTPIIYAIEKSNLEMIKFLLSKQATVNVSNI